MKKEEIKNELLANDYVQFVSMEPVNLKEIARELGQTIYLWWTTDKYVYELFTEKSVIRSYVRYMQSQLYNIDGCETIEDAEQVITYDFEDYVDDCFRRIDFDKED